MRLEARALGFGYPGKPVGRGVDLAVGVGEVVCLLGPNGSGKTTLFKTLLGLLPAQGGEVWIDGRLLESLARSEVARRVAYVRQAHAAHFPYVVLDMVIMGRTAHLGPFARPGARDHAAAMAALETLGIADLAAADYTRISGGQRQLALIARALAQAAPLIVMDEPTASLDFGNQALVLREVRARRAGLRHRALDPRSRPRVRVRQRGRAAAQRRPRRPRAARSGAEPGAPGGGLRRAGVRRAPGLGSHRVRARPRSAVDGRGVDVWRGFSPIRCRNDPAGSRSRPQSVTQRRRVHPRRAALGGISRLPPLRGQPAAPVQAAIPISLWVKRRFDRHRVNRPFAPRQAHAAHFPGRCAVPRARVTVGRASRHGRPPRCPAVPFRGHRFPRSHGPAEHKVNGHWLTARYCPRGSLANLPILC
jgi:iron complex transport system ATP-binding protein